jgi:hypothetical protein
VAVAVVLPHPAVMELGLVPAQETAALVELVK